jgi:hypothetical protein
MGRPHWSKTYIGPNVHRHTARMHRSQRSCHFVNASWKSSSAILPPSSQLCQNGGLSVSPSIGETEKSRVGGDDSHVVFSQKLPDEEGSVRRCVVVMQQPVLS